MDATQMINDSILESDEEENEEEKEEGREDKRGRPLAKLCILKNEHIPETELPLFLGENVLGRDLNTCTLHLPAPSISKQHATICISVYKKKGCYSDADKEALIWDLGSMNGTRKGRLKLTPNVRYALSECDSLVVADIPCQYVSCAADTVPSHGDVRTPVSRNSGLKARLQNASGEKQGDTSTGSKKCVHGGRKARVSLPDLEDTRKVPVRGSCLTFEQTPTQPQGTLVPQSDSDSDGERGGVAERRRKAIVSDSDSYKSSLTCSTFLSPTSKIVPESEDECPITPLVSTKNRPHQHVSFSKDETDMDVGRQQLKEKKELVIMDNSEEEEGVEEERAAMRGRKAEESVQQAPVKQEGNVSRAGEDELPVSTSTVFTDAIPAFNMDSDTDVEGEEEGVASVGAVTLNTNQQAKQAPNTAQFHMDSDTDVDEEDDALDNVPKSVPFSADNSEPPRVVAVIQPEAITMDSDTDVDDDAAVSDGASKPKAVSFQSIQTADSAPSTQPKDFHLDSDTDVDEEEEEESGAINASSKIEESPARSDIKPIEPVSTSSPHHSLHLDSDTDDEAIPAPAVSEALVVSAVTELPTTADMGADVDILSDSDKDAEDDTPLVIPFVITDLSFTESEALQSDSDADTEPGMPPAGDVVNPANLNSDNDTDVEDKEADFGRAAEGQIPSLCRETTPGLLVPSLQNCSTPVHLSEGEGDDVATQAFTSPLSGPFRSSAVRPKALSSCSDSQDDEDFVVAETQSFVIQSREEAGEVSSRGGSFQLGLSDISHLQGHAQPLAMASTQAFVSVEEGESLEDTQAYAATSNAERISFKNDSNLEATQAYGDNEEPARCSVPSEKQGQVDLALEATQAYISEPYCDSDDETDENQHKDTDSAETQPLDFPTSSTIAMAETQPMSAFEEEESLDEENLVSSVLHVKPRTQNKNEERGENGKAVQPQERHLSEVLSVAETQPMCASDEECDDEEDLITVPGKGKAKPLQVEEEQTQPISSELSQPTHIGVDETQPMATSEKEESDGEDLIPCPRKQKAKQLWLEEEQTQTSTNSALSAVENQPMSTSGDVNSDEEDSSPGPRKRKAKPLQLEEEETQTPSNSELPSVETQPMDIGKDGISDEEDSIQHPRKRKAKPLQLEEEQTQSLTVSEVSAVETQLMVTGEDGESDDEDSFPGPRKKRKAKPVESQEEETQSLTNSEASTVETQPLETKTALQSENKVQSEAGTSGITIRGKRGARAVLREEEEQAMCSELPKRQTKGKDKVLLTTRRKGAKSHLDEEMVEQAKRAKGKKYMSQQQDEEETEITTQSENKNLMKEQKESRLGEEKDIRELRQLEMQAENAEKLRLEWESKEKETTEQERKEQEEKERADRIQKNKEEQLERERKAKEEKERLEREKAEKEERERLERENARMEEEKREQEEKERSETAKKEQEARLEKERKEQEHQAKLEREAKERVEKEKQDKEAKEKQSKEQEENKEEDHKPKAPARGRRAARRTTTALSTTELEQASISTSDDVPARRTRSRSNSSNSVNSERSDISINTQESRGRGRGRGAKRTSEPPRAPIARASNRRRTVAAELTEQDSNDISSDRVLLGSNSNNSLNSEISSSSLSSQSRGRGGRQRGRGRKTEADSISPMSSQSDQSSTFKPTSRGRKSRNAEECSNVAPHEDDKGKADLQPASTTRGRRRASATLRLSETAVTDKEDPSNLEDGCAIEESLLPKISVRCRGKKEAKSETVEAPVAPVLSGHGDEAKEKRKGRKRELEANTENDPCGSSKIPKGMEKAQTTQAGEEESTDEIPAKASGKGRASNTQAKRNKGHSPSEVEVKEESEKCEEAVERRGRGRPSAVQKNKKEDQSRTSVDQDAPEESLEPQTPTGGVSRKRQARVDSSPVAKTPRSSSASSAATGRFQAASPAYKVLFTGVVDEAGERVLARLGGSMANGVADMNSLVTDKVRRTVKFLCAVAKGVPIVTTQWLEKSGKAGSFLSPNAFIVKDPEQEKKFNFCLQESLRIASSQPLLQGYAIHVTKSVKPEPVQMKDIITCSGASFLSKMPSSHKPQTVVISCEEDWLLCGPASSASIPVVTAEFILTGILQQKLDFQTHLLSAPTRNPQPAGGRGRGRKKT